MIGDIDSHQAHAIRFANRSRVVVLNVDYRLAPEHPFPQGVNDAFAAARWASENLGEARRCGQAAGPRRRQLRWQLRCRYGHSRPRRRHKDRSAGADLRRPRRSGAVATPTLPTCISALISVRKRRRPIEASPILADLKGVAPAIIGVGVARLPSRGQRRLRGEAARGRCAEFIYREYPTLNHGFLQLHRDLTGVCHRSRPVVRRCEKHSHLVRLAACGRDSVMAPSIHCKACTDMGEGRGGTYKHLRGHGIGDSPAAVSTSVRRSEDAGRGSRITKVTKVPMCSTPGRAVDHGERLLSSTGRMLYEQLWPSNLRKA